MLYNVRYFSGLVAEIEKKQTKPLIPQCYFLDRGALELLLNNSESDKASAHWQTFVAAEHRHFYYTETPKGSISPALLENKPLTYKYSEIDEGTKNFAFGMLEDLLKKRGLLARVRPLSRWKEQLYGVFEAGFACYAPDVMPGNLLQPFLIVCDDEFARLFFQDKEVEAALEDAINLCGMEHLIEAFSLDKLYRVSYCAE